MARPNRSLILENIATVLAGITVANGYKTDVQHVERLAKDFDSVRVETTMPWLGIVASRQVNTYHPSMSIRSELMVQIIGHVEADTAPGVSDALGDLEDDIIKALSIDITRDGNAVATYVQETETNETDPDAVDSTGGLTGTIICQAMVAYHRTAGGT